LKTQINICKQPNKVADVLSISLDVDQILDNSPRALRKQGQKSY